MKKPMLIKWRDIYIQGGHYRRLTVATAASRLNEGYTNLAYLYLVTNALQMFLEIHEKHRSANDVKLTMQD